LYNLVFVLPLILITFAIYLGFSNVEKAAEWKKKNIKKLHLIAGIIMLILGLIIILGWI
jgi:cytochrome c biogenesis protein CcdA